MEYTIKGEVTEIYITNRKGKKFISLIDTEDLQRVLDKSSSWHMIWWEAAKNYYLCTTIYLGYVNNKPNYNTLLMHRFIMNAEKDVQIDHIFHNVLDNRKENLRAISQQKNLQNRKSKNINNTSGYRNVSLIENRWVIQMQVEGKNTRLKSYPYDQLDEAGVYAEEMREKYYGKFAGNN